MEGGVEGWKSEGVESIPPLFYRFRENALLNQIKSLQAKQQKGEWDDNLFLREDEITYILNQIDE